MSIFPRSLSHLYVRCIQLKLFTAERLRLIRSTEHRRDAQNRQRESKRLASVKTAYFVLRRKKC